MDTKVTFKINGWSYDIFVEKDFAIYLQSKISKDFSIMTPDSRKAIINAYIKANYELFEQEEEINKIIESIA